MRARVPLSLFVLWCAVFPSFVDWPEMLGIMAGMYSKDISTLLVVYGSGICYAGLAGSDAPHVMFPSGVARPRMPCIVAVMDQKDSGALIVDSCSDMCKASIAGFTARCLFPLVVGRPAGWSVRTRRTIMQFAGFAGDDAPRAVLLFFVVRPKMLGIIAGMTEKDSCLEKYRKIGFFWEMTSYVSVFSSLVRQWIHFLSVYRGLVSDCRKLRSLRSCSSSLVIDVLFVLQRLISMVQTIQQFKEIPLSPFVLGGRCRCYAGRAVSQVPPWRRHSCSHSCISLRNCRGFPQLQFTKVVHIPVLVQRPIPMVL